MAVDSGLAIPIGILAAHRLSAAARLAYAWLLAEGLVNQGEGQVNADRAQQALGFPADQFAAVLSELEDYGVIRLTMASPAGPRFGGDSAARAEGSTVAPGGTATRLITYELTPLDEIDWTLLGATPAVAGWPTVAAAGSDAVERGEGGGEGRGQGRGETIAAELPDGDGEEAAPAEVAAGATEAPGRVAAEGLASAEVAVSGDGATAAGTAAPPVARASLHGTPDRLLTLDQRVQKYGLEPTLARIYQQVGAAFTPEMVQMLVGWAEEDAFHFPPAVIGLIVDECARRGKLHPRYMQKVAEAWYQEGVRSLPQAQEMVAQQRGFGRLYQAICHRLNLARRLTQDEMALCRKWVDEWGFSEEAVLAACGETVKTTSPSFRYIDAVLQAWYDRRVTASRQAGAALASLDGAVVNGSASASAGARPGASGWQRTPVASPHAPERAAGAAGSARSRGESEKRRRQDYWGAYRRMIGRAAAVGPTGALPAQTGGEGSEQESR